MEVSHFCRNKSSLIRKIDKVDEQKSRFPQFLFDLVAKNAHFWKVMWALYGATKFH